MKEVKRLALVIGCLLLFVVFYLLCMAGAQEARDYYASEGLSDTISLDNLGNVSVEYEIRQSVIDELTSTVKITGLGDIMVYEYQMKRAYDSETDTFDFTPSFAYISSYLSDSSYVLGNLEGTMAGKDNGVSSNTYGYWADTSTLNFNIPEAIADALVLAGVDMLTTANNHLLDSGTDGIASTIQYITDAGLDQTGSFASETDTPYEIKNINGVNVGIIAYTNFLNEELDEDYSYAVNCLYDYSETAITEMCSQISEMRRDGADVVVVNLHFGEKYVTEVSDEERDLATRLVEAGADVIFGSYPHVVKPVETITVEDSDGTSRTGIVFYSLGNFISSMQYQSANGYDRDLGAIASVTFLKTSDGVVLSEVDIVPVYVDFTDEDIAVIPVCEAYDNPDLIADRLAADDLSYLDEERIAIGYETVIETMLGDSGLTYMYEDYKYKITFQN